MLFFYAEPAAFGQLSLQYRGVVFPCLALILAYISELVGVEVLYLTLSSNCNNIDFFISFRKYWRLNRGYFAGFYLLRHQCLVLIRLV